MISKKISIPVATVALAGSVALGTGKAYAQTNNQPLSGLVSLIASKFHLDQNQVQSVVESYWQNQAKTREDNRQTRLQVKLDKLVSENKITSAQKDQILAELESLKSKFSLANFRGLTGSQRKQELEDMRAEIQSWSKTTGINANFLMPGWGMKGLRWLHSN